LGYCYFLGHGTDKNEKKGIRLLKNSSNTSDLTQSTLDSLYHSASTLNQDFTEALKCYQKSSKIITNGDPLEGIGLLYEHGDGVEQNYDNALAYYKQATDQNNNGAYYNLGFFILQWKRHIQELWHCI
jgi:TPR repeat protein